MPPNLANNFLQVPLADFAAAAKPFRRKRLGLGQALLAYEAGCLSIQCGEATAIMPARGAWHGRATFSPEALRALAAVPPAVDPIPIAYADGHLLIGGMTIACHWEAASSALVLDLDKPDLLGLLALARTMPRVEDQGSELGKRVRAAKSTVARQARKAAAALAELGVTDADIQAVVDARITARLMGKANPSGGGGNLA
ncbi:MAG: hypothetical protein JNM32_02455 [Dechloromonas sp.]|jgi:hypothetical protein|nr:hypothetical protein [Dechloromonas sp.]